MLQTSAAFASKARPRAVAIWLFVVAAMIVGIVVVGGITRLTESGLSITTWKPLSGVLPPMDDGQWQAELANYRQIDQSRTVHAGITLAEFKGLFFWEYIHRMIGRTIGLAFALPLIWFAVRRRIPAGYGWRLGALLALGALQGTLGWLMVRSGLRPGQVEVGHGWLAAHLLTAMFTLAGMVWTALDLLDVARNPYAQAARLRRVSAVVGVVFFAQLMYGAFTAGLRAGKATPEWPLMYGRFFPGASQTGRSFVDAIVDDPLIVQFIHRWFAFVAAGVLMWLAIRATTAGSRAGFAVIALVTLQIILGIATLMTGVRIEVAVAHQLNAALLLIAAVVAAHAVGLERRVR